MAYTSIWRVKGWLGKSLMVLSEIRARMFFCGEREIPISPIYTFLYIPEDFLLGEEGCENNCEWYEFTNGDAWISIRINYEIGNREINVDTEDVNEIRNIQTRYFEGVLVREENIIRLVVVDDDYKNSIQITAKNVEVENVIKLIENVFYTK